MLAGTKAQMIARLCRAGTLQNSAVAELRRLGKCHISFQVVSEG